MLEDRGAEQSGILNRNWTIFLQQTKTTGTFI